MNRIWQSNKYYHLLLPRYASSKKPKLGYLESVEHLLLKGLACRSELKIVHMLKNRPQTTENSSVAQTD